MLELTQWVEYLWQALYVAAVLFAFFACVLLLALADAGLLLLLLRWHGRIKELAQLVPEPESNVSSHSEGAGTAVVIGGGIKRWD